MIIISYHDYYSKPTVRTKISKDEAIRRYSEALERKEHLNTVNNNNTRNSIVIPYKSAFLLICGGVIVGLSLLIYSVGYKLGKSKCNRYRYKS